MSKKSRVGIGVDIGSRRIHLAALRSTGKGITVDRIASKDLPHETIVDGVVTDSELVRGHIRELLAENKIRNRNVAISVGGRQVMIKRIETDEMTDDELESAIEYEANTNLPFKLDEVSLDYSRTHHEGEDGSMQVLLVAAKNDAVFNLTETFRWAGGRVGLMEAEPFALQAALIESGDLDEEGTVAVLQIGFQSTDVSIFDRTQFEGNRNMPVGGKSYVEGLIRELGITFEKAAAILANPERTEEEQAALDKVSGQMSTTLLDRIERGLPEFFGTMADKPVTKIVLCGGGSELPGIQSALRERFDMDVEPAQPFRNLDCSKVGDRFTENDSGCDFASAIGLALRSIGDQYPGFNLLFPADRPEARKTSHLSAQTVLPIVGLSAMLLGMAIVHISQETRLGGLQARLGKIRSETDLYRDKIAVVEDLTRKRADISARIDIIRDLDRNRFERVELMSLVNKNVPPLTWITSVKESKNVPNAVLVSGVTQSNIKVADFMTRLLSEDAVRGVDLLVSQQGEIAEVPVTQFTLQASVPGMTMKVHGAEPQEDQLAKGAKAIRDKRAAVDRLKNQAGH